MCPGQWPPSEMESGLLFRAKPFHSFHPESSILMLHGPSLSSMDLASIRNMADPVTDQTDKWVADVPGALSPQTAQSHANSLTNKNRGRGRGGPQRKKQDLGRAQWR